MSRNLSSLIDQFESPDEKEVSSNFNPGLSSLIDDFEGEKTSALRANVYASTSLSPEAAAQQYDISKQTNIPVGIVRTNENEIKQQTEFNSINYDDLVNNFPKTALQLADVNKAGAIRDDIDNLSYFEKIVGSVKQEYKTADENVDLADLQIKRMLFDVSGNEKYKLSPLEENNLDLINESQSKRKDFKLGFVSSIPSYTAAAIPTILSTIPQTLGGAAVGAGAGFAVGGPAGAAVGAGIGSKVGTAYGAGKLETGLAYQELRNLVDEKGQPIEKQVAAGGAVATGVVNGLLELVPFEAATAPIKKAFSREGIKQLAKTTAGKEYLKNIGKLALAEGVTEGLQELSNIVFAESAKAISTGDFKTLGMKDANDTEGFAKFLSDSANRIAESAKAGVGGGIGLGAASGGVTYAKQTYDQRQQNQNDKGIIGQTIEKIKESKIFKRSPELFKDATQDTLGAQEVYMPAQDVLTFFQTKSPEEQEQFFKAVPEARKQFQEALETGGNLVLPGNSVLTAIAGNENLSGLKDFMSFSPESLTEKEAQDTFLNDATSNVNFESEVKQKSADGNKVKNNIKNQILGLRLPKDEAQNLITTLTSYYDTKSARYGSQEAQKVLDNYLGSLEVKNAPNRKSTVRTVDELDTFINKAKSFTQTSQKKGKPLLKFLREKGGVKVGSNLAGELKNLGITTKTAPGLFKKENGIGDIDNIPASEFQERFPNAAAQVEGDYIGRQAMLDLFAREAAGEDISQGVDQDQEITNRFLDDLDRLGIDIKTATNQEIKKAISDFQKQSFEQSNLKPSEQLRKIAEEQETEEQILDQFLKEAGIEVKTEAQKKKAFHKLTDKQKLEITSRQEEVINRNLNNYFNQRVFFQTSNKAPTFYSALEKSISDIPQGKGSPEQWSGIIKNLTQKGVKQEEIEWSGVQDWLKEQKGSVTKEQIVDYLKANQIQVEEVVKGQEPKMTINEWLEGADAKVEFDEKKEEWLASFNLGKIGWFDSEEEAWEVLKEEADDQIRDLDRKQDTKFEKYTLPGGENYRELLLTLPNEKYDLVDRESEEIFKSFENVEEAREHYYTLDQVERSKTLLKPQRHPSDNYKSSHFEEKNVLAHIRFNERTDKDGNKVMFIEEVQSDWHQEGRKKGYQDKEFKKIAEEQNNIRNQIKDIRNQINDEIKKINYKGFDTLDEASRAFIDAAHRREDFAKIFEIPASIENLVKKYIELEKAIVPENNNVPDAPFKTTWNELAFKRALMWAVENDFDKVAWTTGEQQAERYDLSKQVDNIDYSVDEDGTFNLSIQKDGKEILTKENQTLSELEDLVGKDIAKKIKEGDGQDLENDDVSYKRLSGLDLKVGGEGMKAFYDKIVPTMANKLVKRFGGKVENTQLKFTDMDFSEYDKYPIDHPYVKKNAPRVHSLEITPSMRESIQESGLPLFQGKEQSPLGQTQFLGQKPIISLFKNKNRSTLLHELGHVFLQIEQEVSQLPNVSEQIKSDWKVLEDWLGIQGGKVTLEAHEKFARGFEAYLREGRAPSIGLRNAFRRFKSWLTAIYKNVKALNVELSNPVREVFDRMLATDEAIDELRNNPIFRADEKILAMLDEEEKAKYLALTENADEKAKEKLLAKALKEVDRENTKSYKEQKQKVRAKVEEELKKTPVFRAFETLRSEDGFKINVADLENYEGDFAKKLPKDILAEDGVAVDMAADFLGFSDGGVMLNELANAPNFKSEVNRLTSEAMAQIYSDMTTDGSIQEKAVDESQNDARANKILYELNATNAKVKTFIDSKEAYEQKAKDIIAAKQIKDATNSYVFYLAEVKAAREAGVALGAKDYEKAVEWKKKQLLNHYLYRESLKVKDEVEDLRKRSIRYNKTPAVGKVWIDEEYRQNIVSLLEDFNLAENTIGHEKTNIADLEAWKREQTEEGVLGLINFSEIASFQDKDNIQNLTVEEFQILDNAISNLAHVGQGLRTLEIDGKKVEIDEIATEIKETIENNLKEREEVRGNLTSKQKLNAAFESFITPLIKTKEFAEDLDGKPLGTFYNYFVKPVASGEINRNKLTEETYEKLDAIYKKHFGTKAGEISGKKVFVPAVNFSYSKQDMIAFALNWGNGTNRKRIRDGFKYSDAQINAILSNLSKNEWEFVQDMWDLIGSYFKDISDLQRKLVGFRPRKVRAVPFVFKTADGQNIRMKGGYYPLMYDDHLAFDTNEQDLNAVFGNANSNISFEKSYTKGRSEQKVSKRVDLSLKPAFRHLSAVISDIALKEQVWNSYKILNTSKVKQAIGTHAGKETNRQLDTWLKDIFGSGLLGQDAYSGIVNAFRAGTSISTMGAKLSTALMQPSGFTQSIVKIGYGNMLKGVLKTLGNGNPMQINKAVHEAMEKSKVLKERSKTYHQDIFDTLRKMERKNIIAKNAIAIYFWPMAKMQMLVDIPTWNGAYYKGLKDFDGNEEKAIDYADLMVVQAQGSGLEQDLSAFERGSAFGQRKSSLVKIFTAFFTYFNAKFNLARRSYRKTNFSKPQDVARFASDFLLLFWLETLIGQILVGKGPDEDDKENFMAYNLKLTAQTFFSQFPISREAVSVTQGFNGTPSGLSGIEKIVKGGMTVADELTSEEEIDISKVIEGLNDAAGIVFKYPSGQIDVFIDASQRESGGEDVALRDYLLRPKN